MTGAGTFDHEEAVMDTSDLALRLDAMDEEMARLTMQVEDLREQLRALAGLVSSRLGAEGD